MDVRQQRSARRLGGRRRAGPTELKDATDAYAAERRMTVAHAVTDLVGRGMEAASDEDSVKALEERLPQKLDTSADAT